MSPILPWTAKVVGGWGGVWVKVEKSDEWKNRVFGVRVRGPASLTQEVCSLNTWWVGPVINWKESLARNDTIRGTSAYDAEEAVGLKRIWLRWVRNFFSEQEIGDLKSEAEDFCVIRIRVLYQKYAIEKEVVEFF